MSTSRQLKDKILPEVCRENIPNKTEAKKKKNYKRESLRNYLKNWKK